LLKGPIHHHEPFGSIKFVMATDIEELWTILLGVILQCMQGSWGQSSQLPSNEKFAGGGWDCRYH
jgi:hypothetical protein